MLKNYKFLLCILSLWAPGFSGCSLSSNSEGEATLYFSVQGGNFSEAHLVNARNSASLSASLNDTSVAPSSMAAFSCLMINIQGEGIPSTLPSRVPSDFLPGLLNQTSYCSYPGITSEPILLSGKGAEIGLSVPVGDKRIVQIIGIQDPDKQYCVPGVPMGTTIAQEDLKRVPHNVAFYEIGRAIVPIFQDTSVTIKDSYSKLSDAEKVAKRVDCVKGQSSTSSPSPTPSPSSSAGTTVEPPQSLSYSSSSATYITATSITPNVAATAGGTPTIYTVSPALPAGLSLNASTGIITGAPTASTALASYVVTAANSGGFVSAVISITVNPGSFDDLTYNDIVARDAQMQTGTVSRISEGGLNPLIVGDVIVYKTNSGRYGKLKVTGINVPNADMLQIQFVTYAAGGAAVYSQNPLITISSTFPYDLDDGGGVGTYDIIWGNAPPNYLEGYNTGKIYRYTF